MKSHQSAAGSRDFRTNKPLHEDETAFAIRNVLVCPDNPTITVLFIRKWWARGGPGHLVCVWQIGGSSLVRILRLRGGHMRAPNYFLEVVNFERIWDLLKR